MKIRVVLVVLVFALMGLLAWWVLGDGDVAPGSGSTDSAVGAPAASPGAPAPHKRVRAGTEVPADAPEAAASSAEIVVEPPPADGFTITVADDAGAPISDVEVAILVCADDSTEYAYADDEQNLRRCVAFLREHGRVFRADAAGRVRLPRFPDSESAWVGAVHEDLVGVELVADTEMTLALVHQHVVRVHVVRVRVLDAAGEPAEGVRVGIVDEDPWDAYLEQTATTGTDGLAEITDPFETTFEPGESVVYVTALLPLAERLQEVLDRDAPQDLITLRLPPTGSVLVSAPGVEDGDAWVTVRPAGSSGPVLAEEVEVRDGQALFRRVGPGLALEASLYDTGGRKVTVVERFDGPAAAGRRVRVEMAFAEERPIVTGVLVGAGGEPVVAEELQAYVLEVAADPDDALDRAPTTCTTDVSGRFRFAMDRTRAELASSRFAVYRRVTTSEGHHESREIFRVKLPPAPVQESHDVGTITLAAEAVLAEGTVLWPGERASRPRIRLEFEVRPRVWRRTTARAEYSDDGRAFRISGDVEGDRFRVYVEAAGHALLAPVEFERGAKDVVVPLAAAGGVRGSVRLPPGLSPSVIRVHVAGEPARAHSFRREWRVKEEIYDDLDSDGSFEISNLLPGVAEVRVRFTGQTEVLARIPRVRIAGGETNTDPRLQGIDLRTLVRAHAIDVVAADGAPAVGCTVHFRPTGSPDPWMEVVADGNGRAVIAAPAGVDVLVGHEGHTYASLSDVRADRRVQLVRGAPSQVVLRLAPDVQLPEAPYALSAELEWRGPSPDELLGDGEQDPRGFRDDDIAFGPDRQVVHTVHEPGVYGVTLWFVTTTGSSVSWSGLGTVPADPTVHVTPAAGRYEIVLAPDPEELRLALEAAESD